MGTKQDKPTADLDGRDGPEGDMNTTTDRQTDAAELSLDHTFEILKNHRRREVLSYLREHEREVTLSDLAEHIAAIENDTDVKSITSSQRKRVYVGLYQCHLPKMADMDIIEFNQNRGIVRIGPNAPDLFEYIDTDSNRTDADSDPYLRLSAVGLVLTPAVLLATGVAELVAFTGLLATLVALCALSVRDVIDTDLRSVLSR